MPEKRILANVKETQTLYDTVLIGGYIDAMEFHDGWFSTFAAIGAANEIPFFNVRNRNHHLAYNNQDKRDQVATGMRIYNMGVSFFAPQVATQFFQILLNAGGIEYAEEIHSAVWEADLPQHAGAILRINQDDRLKISCAMAQPGYGPCGGGMGHGDPTRPISNTPTAPFTMKGMTTQGVPEITNKWRFPEPIEVPRNASLSVVIKFSEWARQLLQTMSGPLNYGLQEPGGGEFKARYCTFGIQVSLGVERLVQQRGQYHY